MIKESRIGESMHKLAQRLYPICRSITGNGVRESLRMLKEDLPLEIFEVPSGTQVFDWTVPKEWNIREAWVKDAQGNKVIDFAEHSLHILNYSTPLHEKMQLEKLKSHIYSLPDQPDLIPYRTSYYREQWGFCMRHDDLEKLEDGEYEVFIDSSLEEGSLTYGELFIPGESEEEVIFSAHICHPSLANDNLAGIAVVSELAKSLLARNNRYSYRFLFIPGTIGSITWLAENEDKISNIKHGLVASLLGDPGNFTYKRSRRGNAEIDQIVEYVLEQSGKEHKVIDFFPYGYDERQFCSPAFNLAVGNFTRTQFGQYPEYHTSGDNLELVRPEYLEESLEMYQKVVEILEANKTYLNLSPKCEPQLGKRGLYDAIGGNSDSKALQMAMLWVLNLADGEYSLLDMAKRSGISFDLIAKIADTLIEKELLAERK
ncbi:MAG: DUF4910 domain-containing protein [Bacteroidota bacterium]